jgi:ESS family glutamate:Na+ symporter
MMDPVTESPVTVFQIDQMDMLSLSIVVLFVGMFINRKVRLLRENYIPPAVTGGLIFSTGAALLYNYGGIELEFDLRLRDLLLLVFFSTVGLSAQLRTLVTGGKALAILVVVAAVFLIVQDATGVGLALLTGNHPGYGLMGGSVSLAGGHGTAIAWGTEAAAAGLAGAEEIGIIFATFGLICGGLLGGPIARSLMKRHGLEGRTSQDSSAETIAQGPAAPGDQLFNLLRTLMILAICVSLGDTVNRYLFSQGMLLPGFLTSMFVAIAITNIFDVAGRPLSKAVVDGFGQVSLNVFLSMSMMSIQLWVLAGGARIIMLVLALQVLVMTFFASRVVFRVMGRNYDAVVMASGFAGLGLGATPIAIANMDAVTQRYGPSPQAFLVIPLIGAFFIDLLNAAVIKMFIQIISRWLI